MIRQGQKMLIFPKYYDQDCFNIFILFFTSLIITQNSRKKVLQEKSSPIKSKSVSTPVFDLNKISKILITDDC